MIIDAPLFSYQRQAVERLKRLKVGALYMEPGTGKLRTVLELARLRLNAGKIDGVLWLCSCRVQEETRRQISFLTGEDAGCVRVIGLESLSHSWRLLLDLEKIAKEERMMLVIDGGELVKSIRALRTVRAMTLSKLCPYRLLVSEVPLIRSVEDMFSQWCLLDWRILGYQSFWSFSLNHLEINTRAPAKRFAKNMDYLLRRIEPYTCQVLRSDCRISDERTEYIWKFRLNAEVIAYYRSVIERFLETGRNTPADVYRLLGACQQMVSGRSIVSMRPLKTAALYRSVMDNPRIQALLGALTYYPEERILILCRFRYEEEDVLSALRQTYPAEPCGKPGQAVRLMVLNRMCSDCDREVYGARVVIHYSHDWDWGSRRRAEQPLNDQPLTIVNLVAVGTIDIQILDCLKHKKNLAAMVQQGLTSLLPAEEKHYAQNLY